MVHPFLALVSAASVPVPWVAYFNLFPEAVSAGGLDRIAADIGEEKQTVHCVLLNRVEKHNIA